MRYVIVWLIVSLLYVLTFGIYFNDFAFSRNSATFIYDLESYKDYRPNFILPCREGSLGNFICDIDLDFSRGF